MCPGLQGRVHPGKQALRGGFFVTGSAIDLPRKKQPANGFGFKTGFERSRVKVVVFNGVTGPQNVGVFQPHHAAHQIVLDVKRQAGADAVGVVLIRRQALRLQKNLVAFFVGKAVDLVFHTRAITRPHTVDLAGKHGAAVKAAFDDGVRAGVGMGDVTRHLRRVHAGAAHEAEDGHVWVFSPRHAVARLKRAFGKVNRAAIQARRRAGFKAALRQLQLFEPCAQ